MSESATGLWGSIQGLGAAGGGLAYAGHISDKGDQYASNMGALAGTLQSDTAFKGYGVKTGLEAPGQTSGMVVGADGKVTMDLGGVGQATSMSGISPTGQNYFQQGMANMNNAYLNAPGGTNALTGQATGAMANSLAGLGAQQATGLGASQQAMANAMMDTSAREDEIYRRAMAMQQPQLDAQRASSNANEYAAGRGGVMGSQFGGTGEDQAMARAQAQAQNQAAFQAMGQAQQEIMNQANMASQFGQMGLGAAGAQANVGNMYGSLGAQNAQLGIQASQNQANIAQQQAMLGNAGYQSSFLPLQQQLNAMQVGQQGAGMQQSAQFTGAGYGAQLGLGAIQTQVNADKAASELYGNIVGSMMDNANNSEGSSWLGGILGATGLFGGSS